MNLLTQIKSAIARALTIPAAKRAVLRLKIQSEVAKALEHKDEGANVVVSVLSDAMGRLFGNDTILGAAATGITYSALYPVVYKAIDRPNAVTEISGWIAGRLGVHK